MVAAFKKQLLIGAALVKKIVRMHVEQWVRGLIWMVVSSVVGLVGVIAVLLSLFFELAKMPAWAAPSFITGIVALLLAVIGMIESKRLWRITKGR